MNRKTLITVFLLFLHCGLKAQTDVADSVRLDTVDYIQVGLLQAQDYAIAHNKSFENASLDVKKHGYSVGKPLRQCSHK